MLRRIVLLPAFSVWCGCFLASRRSLRPDGADRAERGPRASHDTPRSLFPMNRVNCVNFAPPSALLALLALLVTATPALSRDSLGMFSGWGAFRDPAVPRCYAIAMAVPSTKARDYQPYAAIGTWPRREVRGQVHFRLSRKLAPGTPIVLSIGRDRFRLTGGGGDAWAADRRMDAAIVAAMRSATRMTVSARDAQGRRFSNTWQLAGAATAMDAAAVGCVQLR